MNSVRATREEVKRFLSVEKYYRGYEYGSGYSDGYKDGSGFGYGNGKGSYDGYGFGYGSGYGAGYKDGYGYGSSLRYEDGSGSGPGFSSSPGFGFGYGNGDVTALNGNIVDYIDNVPTIIIQVHGNFAYGYIVKDDLTLSPCFIAKVSNSFAHGKTLKEAVADAKAKELEKMTVEERIAKFVEAFGPLDSEHTGKEFYDWHHILTGSCRIGRDEFCKSHNIGFTKMYSVKYFLDITEESYGGDIIKLIRKEYKNINE